MPEYSNSAASFEKANRVIPGGVNSPARAFGAVGGTPPFMERGAGAYLFDTDGNKYIDYVGSWGPLILGHCQKDVVAAVDRALRAGASFGAPTELETQLAELVVSAVPSIEKIRFVSSGTEASMTTVRLARGFTGRDKIIKFAGCYHGHVDSLLVQAGSSATTLGVPSSPGVPAGATTDTIVLPFNDLAAVHRAFDENSGQIAAIMLEPVVGNMGTVAPGPEFLEGLREVSSNEGALLVFDEVMTGFRLSLAGAQGLFNITPDLTVLGKIIGGGLPVGAVGGRAEIMDRLMPVGPVFQAGTLSGNPLAMASGIATLKALIENPPYEQLELRGQQLAQGLDRAATAADVPHTVTQVGSMVTLFFSADPITDYAAAVRCDTERFGKYFWAMLDRGVYLPCSQFEAAFLSVAHCDEDVNRTIAAAEESLEV